jgi:hypothetical protein
MSTVQHPWSPQLGTSTGKVVIWRAETSVEPGRAVTGRQTPPSPSQGLEPPDSTPLTLQQTWISLALTLTLSIHPSFFQVSFLPWLLQPHSLVASLFLKPTNHSSTSGPLHMRFPQLGMLSPQGSQRKSKLPHDHSHLSLLYFAPQFLS